MVPEVSQRSISHMPRGNSDRPEAVAILANQLLRDLGYSANLNDLRSLFS